MKSRIKKFLRECDTNFNTDNESLLVELIADCFNDLQPQWVSVDDRVPVDTIGHPCIVAYSNDSTGGEPRTTPGSFVIDDFCVIHQGGWSVIVGTTHWMDYPLPPSEGE